MDIAPRLSLPEYSLLAAQRCCHGPCEGESLPLEVLLNLAPHPCGWAVDGFEERQWLAAYCPACGYWNSFWQLGVPGALGANDRAQIASGRSVEANDRNTKDPEKQWSMVWAGCTASIILGLVLTNVALDRAARKVDGASGAAVKSGPAEEAGGQVVPARFNR
jgi:hypothetical protein